MRDHSRHIELSRQQAVEGILELCDFGAIEDRVELVSLAEAQGRVLARDVLAQTETPNVLTCCMDSIAVRWEDFENGDPDTSTWVRGVNWQFANTGIAMPAGFDTAIVIEHVAVSEDQQHVSIDAAPSKRFAGTRPAGSTQKVGDVLAAAGTVVTPDVMAQIAGGNVTSVPVVRKPRVAFIPTGNELIAPGGIVPAGRNLETNSILARGKIEQWGGQPMIFDIVPDIPERIEAAVLDACALADIVVLNAGSSKGSDDWSCEQLEALGRVVCHETNHGPGHHSSYAYVNGTPVVGISGPSGGASFTMNFYLRPLMRTWLGFPAEPARIVARLTEAFPGKGSKNDAVKPLADETAAHAAGAEAHKREKAQTLRADGEVRPSVVNPDATFYGIKFVMLSQGADGMLQATPVKGHAGSRETWHANAYYMMPSGPGIKPPVAGDLIEVELR